MREWLRNHPGAPGYLALALCIILVVMGVWGLGMIGSSSSTDSTPWTAPTRCLIEVYEQHPAGMDEVWHVVVWWEDGEIRETMVRSDAARDRLVECVNN